MTFSQQLKIHNSYFKSHVTRDLSWRRHQLLQIKKLIGDNEKIILSALQQDLAKPTQEAWITELSYITTEVDYVLKNLKRWTKIRRVSMPLIAQPGRAYIQAEPQGTVLIIGAWNYPLQLIFAPLIAIIAAGNCAIIKPSELSAATAKLLEKLLPQYLDNQAVSIIQGGVEETTELLKLKFDHIMYTGNSMVGKIVMQAASIHLTPITLELGGKSPVYVDSSVNIAITAQRLTWGKWLNAGQTCIAPDYIITTKEMLEPLIKAINETIFQMFGNQPKSSKSYGRIVNQAHTKRIASYMDSGEIVIGGEVNIEQCYIAPTVIINPKVDSKLMTEEIFGPLLPIITVDNFLQAKAFIAQREKPLAAYLFSKNKQQQSQWINEISAGSQGINDVVMFNAVPELAIAGVGASGFGQYSGKIGFNNFSHLKSVLYRPFFKDLSLRFAPYSTLKMKLLRFIR